MTAIHHAGRRTLRWAELPVTDGTVARATARALRRHQQVDTAGSLLGYVVRHAEENPQRPAVVEGARVLTYQALVDGVAAARELLQAHGVSHGGVVAAAGPRSSYTPLLFLALESLGASYLPLDPAWPVDRARDVLSRSRAALLVDYAESEAVCSAARAAAGSENVAVLRIARGKTGPAKTSLPHQTGDRSAEPRYTIFTSGTTGRPKGATVEHRGMLNHLWAKVEDLALGPKDAVAFTAPLVFDISIWQMLSPLLAGGRVVVVPDSAMRFPRWLIEALDAAAVTVVELVPTVVGWLVDQAGRAGERSLATLRFLLSTGEELRPALAARVLETLPHVTVVNAYGPTECSDDVSHHVVTPADVGGSRLPVGSPIINTSLYLLVREPDGRWRAAEDEEPGELFVGGTGVGLGYLNDPDTTAGAFFRDPFDPGSPTGRLYRTGDLARFSGGRVYYLGRTDRQVKVSGVRMELDEIEAVLSRHPQVSGCAVTVAVGPAGEDHLVAHYALRAPASSEELQASVGEKLPAAMVPRRWLRWDELPLTANGKVDQQVLRAAAQSTQEQQ